MSDEVAADRYPFTSWRSVFVSGGHLRLPFTPGPPYLTQPPRAARTMDLRTCNQREIREKWTKGGGGAVSGVVSGGGHYREYKGVQSKGGDAGDLHSHSGVRILGDFSSVLLWFVSSVRLSLRPFLLRYWGRWYRMACSILEGKLKGRPCPLLGEWQTVKSFPCWWMSSERKFFRLHY